MAAWAALVLKRTVLPVLVDWGPEAPLIDVTDRETWSMPPGWDIRISAVTSASGETLWARPGDPDLQVLMVGSATPDGLHYDATFDLVIQVGDLRGPGGLQPPPLQWSLPKRTPGWR